MEFRDELKPFLNYCVPSAGGRAALQCRFRIHYVWALAPAALGYINCGIALRRSDLPVCPLRRLADRFRLHDRSLPLPPFLRISKVFRLTILLLTLSVAGVSQVKVTVDHNIGDNATKEFRFNKVPSPARDNAAAKANIKATLVVGRQ